MLNFTMTFLWNRIKYSVNLFKVLRNQEVKLNLNLVYIKSSQGFKGIKDKEESGFYLQVLDRNLHAGQVHVGDAATGAQRTITDREDVGERLSDHWLVCWDGGHGRPVTLVGHEAGNTGYLVMGGDVNPVGAGSGERGAEEAEEEKSGGPQESVHDRFLFEAQSNEPENHVNNIHIRPGVSK